MRMFRLLTATLSLAALPFVAAAEGEVAGDADAGERAFRKCQACHAVGEDAQNKVGPILNGVVDRQIASVPDFTYSDVLSAMGAEGKTWSPEELAAFLERPRSYAPGTKMSFAGLRNEEERVNLIAYLATFPGEGG